MSNSYFSRFSRFPHFSQFSHLSHFSHLSPLKTLVWRRITPADCSRPQGRIASAHQEDQLLDKALVTNTWHFIEERDDCRKPRNHHAPPTPVIPVSPPLPVPLPLPLPLPLPNLAARCPDIHYENRTTEHRPPVGFRIYHPNQTSSPRTNIFFLPSPTSPFQPDRVIPRLSEITGATIITPQPADIFRAFPESLHTLLKIYDHCNLDSTKTAILTAGMAAPLATSIALTEPAVCALGIWGGVLDLTVHASRATAWNRESEIWEHYTPPPPPQRAPASVLGIPEGVFWTLRSQHFPNPEKWSDPFLSPQLFFRSAGIEFSRLTLKEIWGRNALTEWNRDKMQEEIEELQAQSKGEDLDVGLIYPRRQSRLMLDFPPEKRERPFTRVRIVVPGYEEEEEEEESGVDDVVEAQGLAFAEVYRSGLVRWLGLYKGIHGEQASELAEGKAQVDRLDARGGIDSEVRDMSKWLKWVLEHEDSY